MKVVLFKEGDVIKVLEGNGEISGQVMALRSRLTSGDIKYYELEYDEKVGCPLEGYVAALNMYPELLESSKMLKAIDGVS